MPANSRDFSVDTEHMSLFTGVASALGYHTHVRKLGLSFPNTAGGAINRASSSH